MSSPFHPSSSHAAPLPACRVHLLNNVTASPSPFTVSWDTVNFDTDGFYSAGAPTRLTIPAGLGGYYLVGCNTDWASTPSGRLSIEVDASNKGDTLVSTTTNTSVNANPLVCCSALWLMAAGDYFYVRAIAQNAASAILSGNDDTAFWLVRVAAV